MRKLIAVAAACATVAALGLAVPAAEAAAGCAGEPWMDTHRSPDERATLLVAQMTLDEKVQEMHTISDSQHAREVPANPRLCIPALLMNNGPAGVSSGGPVMLRATALPAPIGQAATFDPSAARRYGMIEGVETRDQGRNLMEGPNLNIARVPLNGRTFEAFGEDPYLAGRIAVGNIQGIQSQGVIADVKHYAANNQETARDSINEVIDQRTLHEIYEPAFQAAVQEGRSGSVMCAKNLVNGVHACQSADLLTATLKGAWDYSGFVISDFNSCHDTVQCADNGLDIELPSATYYGDALVKAVQSGQASEATVDEHVHRVLATMIRFGLFERPAAATPIDAGADGAVARQLAEQATVLLKNSGGQLPLDDHRLRSLALIGPGAATASTGGGGSPDVAPLYTVSPLAAITRRAWHTRVTYAEGMPPANLGPQPAIPSSAFRDLTASYYPNSTWSGTPTLTRAEPWIDTNYHFVSPAAGLPSTGWSVRWTGSLTAPVTGDYTVNLTSRGAATFYLDGAPLARGSGGFPSKTTSVTVHLVAGEAHQVQVDYAGASTIELGWTAPPGADDPDIAAAVRAAKSAAVAVVFAGELAAEGMDRSSLQLPGYQDQLISAVAAANPHTIVVLKTGGPVLMPWLNQVAGVLEAWYPGEEDGNAIAATLFGDAEPAGRLPITFPKSLADTPANTPAQYPGVNGVATYSEGVFVGYRHYDASGIRPLFPFGYGLSYTDFRLSRLRYSHDRDGVTIRVDVQNTGRRPGSQIVQVYAGDPGTPSTPEPPRQLAGFAKVNLRPGQTRQVVIHVATRAFAHWDTATGTWVVPDGTYRLYAGASSADLPLSATLHLTGVRP
ncbi:beta-glucosidase family protein [Actinoplanes subtropicus]|uniref:beta-glucosidase family protein n=1 Tax=Actinoplanes subtropicus TaxID=543632 RepID=UPI0004C40AD4|nr:glycoside hydrolase family 3 C-terminal domain-containing protein [Actinoplanes subtropicus]